MDLCRKVLTDPDTERSCPEAYVAGSLLHAEYEATLPNRAGPAAVRRELLRQIS